MASRVALLRRVNVGAANRIAKAGLRAIPEYLGFANVRTILRSGNLLFDDDGVAASAVASRLALAIGARLGVSVDVVVRSAKAWRAMIAANPFPDAAAADPAQLVVVVLAGPPDASAGVRLADAVLGCELARVIGREADIHYPVGTGDSKPTAPIIDRALGVRGKARNGARC